MGKRCQHNGSLDCGVNLPAGISELNNSLLINHGPVVQLSSRPEWDPFVSKYCTQYHSLCLTAFPPARGYSYLLVRHSDFDEPLFAGVFKHEKLSFRVLRLRVISFGFPLAIARPLLVNDSICDALGAASMTSLLRFALQRLGRLMRIRFVLLPGIAQDQTASGKVLSGLPGTFRGSPMWIFSTPLNSTLDGYFESVSRKRRKQLTRILKTSRSANLTFKISDIEEINTNRLVTPFLLTYEKRVGRCDIDINAYLAAIKKASMGTVKVAEIRRGAQTLAFDMIFRNTVAPSETEVSLTGYDYTLGSGLPLYELLYLCEIQWLMEKDCPVQKLQVGQGCDLPKRRLGGQPIETVTAVLSFSRVLSLMINCFSVVCRLFKFKPRT